VPGFAGQQVSLATDGEEIDWLKKRNIREWFAARA
jgi:hypothetical protein